MPRHEQQTAKLNPRWVRDARRHFRRFLEETGFPEPERNGTRGSTFDYPEWMVMFLYVLRWRSGESLRAAAVRPSVSISP